MTAVPSPLQDWLAAALAGRRPDRDTGATAHGVTWRWHAEGILELLPAAPQARRYDAVLSCGVHGDETAPIELVDGMLRDIDAGALTLRERILVILGNPAAMRAGKRYLEFDLNRLFCGAHTRRAELPAARRAAELERIVTAFFNESPAAATSVKRRHFDMHTAIRPSHFRRFAVVPSAQGRSPEPRWLADLAAADIAAILLTNQPAVTFSYFTCATFGAESCTLELGKVEPFGRNRLEDFSGIDTGLRRWLAGGEMMASADDTHAPAQLFRVAAEIVRQSDAFDMHVPDDTPNFTPYPRGTVLANDGSYAYTVSHEVERIVFPNRNVANGLRAGVMVVPCDLSEFARMVTSG
ncbi:succinylglutamate desuccinylase [Pandoraea terrae]|uniref:Succinylglutamate desuccinylase n=1 Tax=Pandoraea terrae TaxID=1537710 RepID=A0A5E4ZFA9_9BURK|nr:succinylglutamate desuccinylase [Pandoraea terrae]VVE59706.1 succinylglutamate desuccinylase [Pandoraea terrae]